MEELEQKIRAVLDEIRPSLQADGGDLEIVKIEGKNVLLTLTGHCGTCPYAQMTLKNGIEEILRNKVDPEIVVEKN
ncbi:MAG: NifU family protein [Victivallales bacterium]|nr:NifU family protein [Victivallales bacterium]